jgi:hypothetical protein
MKLFTQPLLALTLLSGCATMKYSELKPRLPAIKEGKGRIFVYRRDNAAFCGGAPFVVLNGEEVIGRSNSKGFLVVDKPASRYACSVRTGATDEVFFSLAPGETKYIRNHMTTGLLWCRPNLELVQPDKAEQELEGMTYAPGWPASKAAPALEKSVTQPAIPST